jgi:uncharacterized membrane protein YozB (DUF420 family)
MSTSDMVFLAYVLLIVPAMIVGFVFARRKMFVPYHKFTMTTITIVNWLLIIFVMAVSYKNYVLPSVPAKLGDLGILVPTIHLVPGLIAQLLATYLVIRMWFENQLPEWFKAKNFKFFMRTTLALWLLTFLIGIGNWLLFR